MNTECSGLSAAELLKQVYDSLRMDGKEIMFPKDSFPTAVIEYDWWSERTIYTAYKSATLVEIGAKKWLIAFGIEWGGDVAYNCDIAAIPFPASGRKDEDATKEAYCLLKDNIKFRRSIIVAAADGDVGVRENIFSEKVHASLNSKIKEFVAQEKEIDRRYRTSIYGHPLIRSPTLYKQEFVKFLSDTFREILASV